MKWITALLTVLLFVACSREVPAPGTLHEAAKTGKVAKARRLIDAGAAVNALDEQGRTPLHWAAENDFMEVVKLLVERGADVNGEGSGGTDRVGNGPSSNGSGSKGDGKAGNENTPLHLAAAWRDKVRKRPEIAAFLYSKGAKVYDPQDLVLLLHIAASRGDVATAKKLIEAGANLNNGSYYTEGNSALYPAIDSGSVDMVTLLIDKGASLYPTHLHRAICRHDLVLVKLLAARNKRYELADNWNSALECGDKAILQYFVEKLSPLDYAAIARTMDGKANAELFTMFVAGDTEFTKHFADLPEKAVAAGNAELLALGFEKGISMPEEAKTSLLFTSAKYSTPEVIDVMLEQKIAVDSRTDWGNTPLMLVAPRGFVDVAAGLLKKGANVDAKNELQNTALHIAAARNLTDMVALLIKAGADVNAINKDRNTPLLQAARFSEDYASIKLLLENKADVNAQNSLGMTALHYFVTRLSTYAAGTSSSEGEVQPEQETQTEESAAAVGEDADETDEEASEETAVDKDGVQEQQRPRENPASVEAAIEAMRFLLSKGADPTIKNADGKTALEIAREYSMSDAIREFLEKETSGKRP